MTPTEVALRALLAAALRRPGASIDLDTPLFLGGLELDSVTAADFLGRVLAETGVDVAAEDLSLASLRTLRTLAAFVAERTPDIPPTAQPTTARDPWLGTQLWAYANLAYPSGALSVERATERLSAVLEVLHRDAGLAPVSDLTVREVGPGVAGAVLLAESHASGRVDLARGEVFVDLFSCVGLDLDRARRSVEGAWPEVDWTAAATDRGPLAGGARGRVFGGEGGGFSLTSALFSVADPDRALGAGRRCFDPGPGSAHLQHRFTPHGVSAVVFGPRGQLSLHTWPEHSLVTVDVIAAGDDAPTLSALHQRLGRWTPLAE